MKSTEMILFHGTIISSAKSIMQGIDLAKSKPSVDFGQGFYLTESEAQAIEWVMGRENPAVLKFQFDPSGLKRIAFDAPDERWARFVVANRLQMNLYRYDYAMGPMADARVSRIRKDFISGQITFDDAVERIIGHTNGSQIAVLSPKAVQHLKLLEVMTHELQARRERLLGLGLANPS